MFTPKEINNMSLDEIEKEIKEWCESMRFKGQRRILMLKRKRRELKEGK